MNLHFIPSRKSTALLVALASLASIEAQASLQVFPTRLFLNPRNRVSQLTLRHSANTPETYRITTLFYRQTIDGRLEKIEKPSPEERSLTQFVRFSPRQVTIPANSEQVVKVMALPNETLQDGEYRAHVLFEPVGELETTPQKAESKKVGMNLSARVAVAIPVFYRQGNAELQAAAKNLKFITTEDKKPGFEVELEATGKKFLYGDIQLWFEPEGGKPQEVGKVLGISSYVPKRIIRFPLNAAEGVTFKRGKLRLHLNETQEEGGKLLSTAEVPLP